MSWNTRLFFHITIAQARGPLLSRIYVSTHQFCSQAPVVKLWANGPQAKYELEVDRISVVPVDVEQEKDLTVVTEK